MIMGDEAGGDRLRITILGCGSSPGVPRVNGDWGKCDPANPKNRRMRASILVERIAENGGRTTVVVDTGPDFRAQMLMAGVSDLDAAVYTHAHADHTHGIDDLRSFVLGSGRLMPIWADDATLRRLRACFDYCFTTPEGSDYPPILQPAMIDHGRAFVVDGQGGPIPFEPLPQHHGRLMSLGFRIGDIAYCSDVSRFPQETLERMRGLDILIIDALQYREHPSHLSLAQSLTVIDLLAPRHAYLTHMHTPLDHDAVDNETPAHVKPCHDGLVLERAFPVM